MPARVRGTWRAASLNVVSVKRGEYPERLRNGLYEVDPQGMDHYIQVLVDGMGAGRGAQHSTDPQKSIPLPGFIWVPRDQDRGDRGAWGRTKGTCCIPDLDMLHHHLAAAYKTYMRWSDGL